jgi:hypothetical protein
MTIKYTFIGSGLLSINTWKSSETSMIHWIPNVEVHGHPYGDVWGSDLVGVSLAKTRENKYAFLKIQLICFSLFFFSKQIWIRPASQSWGQRGSWTSTSRGRHQPVVGVLCSFQVPVHSGIWIAGTSFFVCISHQHLFLLVLLFIVLWFWFPTDQ